MLGTYYVSGTVLDMRDVVMKKKNNNKVPDLVECTFWWKRRGEKKTCTQ